eukprot:m.160806 g.160806  ORF g.160806 m.160806 type:complete len:1385 (-) comp15175_c2_seq1:1666-5820(-)
MDTPELPRSVWRSRSTVAADRVCERKVSEFITSLVQAAARQNVYVERKFCDRVSLLRTKDKSFESQNEANGGGSLKPLGKRINQLSESNLTSNSRKQSRATQNHLDLSENEFDVALGQVSIDLDTSVIHSGEGIVPQSKSSNPIDLDIDISKALYKMYRNYPHEWVMEKKMRFVIQEALADVFVSDLNRAGANLRVLFKEVDENGYGYIIERDFKQIMRLVRNHLCDATFQFEAEYLIDYIGFDGGKIEYRSLHSRLYSTSRQKEHRSSWLLHQNRQLRSAVVIVRHGARLPLKAFGNSVHWPKSKAFWEKHGGNLTPVGTQQLMSLGQRFNKKFIKQEKLLDEQSPDLPARVHAYTTNLDRTLVSAQSLLLGMFPGATIGFTVVEDGDESDDDRENSHKADSMNATLSQNNSSSPTKDNSSKFSPLLDTKQQPLKAADRAPLHRRQQQQLTDQKRGTKSSAINILLSVRERTPLLHGYKNNPAYDRLRKETFKIGKLAEWSHDPKYIRLLEKLWNITGYERLDPIHSAFDRLLQMQTVAQQINIERAHGMELLLNSGEEEVDVEDEVMVTEISEYICRLRYCGHTEGDQRVMSKLAAGLLPAAIINEFLAVAKSDNKNGRFTLYSAHDNTLMALLSHLGFTDYPIPRFGSHIVFELHEKDKEFYVKFLYNHDPEFFGFDCDPRCSSGELQPCQYMKIPTGRRQDWNPSKMGDTDLELPLSKFEDILIRERGSFRTEEEWHQATISGLKRGVDESLTASAYDDELSQADSDSTMTPFKESCQLSPLHKQGQTDCKKTLTTEEDLSRKPKMVKSSFRPLHLQGIDHEQKPSLRLFHDQVAGHPLIFFEMGKDKLAKPLTSHKSSTERDMYQRIFPVRTSEDRQYRSPVETLAPFVPQYFGDIFVRSSLAEVEESYYKQTNSTGYSHTEFSTFKIKTRDYDFMPPEEYSAVDFDNNDLLDETEHRDVLFVDANVPQGQDRKVFRSLSHLPEFSGWVRKRCFPTGTWQRRWMVLSRGILYWYKKRSKFDKAKYLSSFNFAKECDSILSIDSRYMNEISWPKLDGVGLGILTIAGHIHGLHFETKSSYLKWRNVLVDELERRLQVGRDDEGQLVSIQRDLSVETDEIQDVRIFEEEDENSYQAEYESFCETAEQPSKETGYKQGSAEKSDIEKEETHTKEFSQEKKGQIYLVLENLTSQFKKPCVLDIKIGTRQHADDHSQAKKDRSIKKCLETTSAALGVRICGMRLFSDVKQEAAQMWDKDFGRGLNKQTFPMALETFFNPMPLARRTQLILDMDKQLAELQSALSQIDGYRFYSSSILLIYDADESNNNTTMRMIDFLNATMPMEKLNDSVNLAPRGYPSPGCDKGALFGIKTLRELLGKMAQTE